MLHEESIFILFHYLLWLQPKENIQTKFILKKIEISKLNEAIWNSAA
jgi:hypothetical protein